MKRLFLIASLLGLFLTGAPNGFAQEEVDRSLDTQSIQTQKRVGPFSYDVKSPLLKKIIPDISVIGTFGAGYFSGSTEEAEEEDHDHDEEEHSHADGFGHDPHETGFFLQEIELALQSVIDPYFRADVFVSFSDHGVELEEAYFTTLGFLKGFQIKGGKFLLPFGRQNQKHLESWAFVNNNLANRYLLGGEGLSELGVEFSYLFPLPFFLEAQLSVSNGSNETSFGGTRKQDFLYQGRLTSSFDLNESLTMLVGASGAFGHNSTAEGSQTRLFGGDLLLKWKPNQRQSLVWQTEYIYRHMQLANGSANDDGFYTYASYQFFKRWQVGLRYDHVGMMDESIEEQWRVSGALSFYPTEYSRIRVQYDYDKAHEQDAAHVALLQFQFVMGTHGAHKF